MANIPRSRRLNYIQSRQRIPTGDQDFLASPAWRKARLIQLQLFPICAACALRGEFTDCTKGQPIDHVISRSVGGAPLDLRNLWTLCEAHHNKKSALEKNGLNDAGVGEPGQLIPIPAEKERVLKILA